MKKISVSFFQRKKALSGNFSVEFLFSDIRNTLRNKIICKVYICKYFSNSIFHLLYNIFEGFFRSFNSDINFICGDVHYLNFLMRRKNTCLVVLDCCFIYNTSGFKRWLLILIFLKIPLKKSRYVITISESSKNDIVLYGKCSQDKVKIIPIYIDERYHYIPKKISYKPILLQIGQSNNKNLARIIEAVSGLDIVLSIVGVISCDNMDKLIRYRIDYVNEFNLTFEQVFEKYIESDILLFPSLYEGFGMPILEAQAIGRPVLTSNISSMPWVSGGAACLVDPYSVLSIRKGILKIIKDSNYRENLIKKGLENTKRFNQKIFTDMYMDVIKNMYEEI